MNGYHADLDSLARQNTDFRRVLYTAKGGQLVLMSLKPLQDIGMEVHRGVDQFFWVVRGKAKATLDGETVELSAGDTLVVPRRTKHNIANASTRASLKLFTVYTPPNHPDGTVQHTKADAEAAERAKRQR